jgi:hypothetical protein
MIQIDRILNETWTLKKLTTSLFWSLFCKNDEKISERVKNFPKRNNWIQLQIWNGISKRQLNSVTNLERGFKMKLTNCSSNKQFSDEKTLTHCDQPTSRRPSVPRSNPSWSRWFLQRNESEVLGRWGPFFPFWK